MTKRIRRQVNEQWYALIENRLNGDERNTLSQLSTLYDGQSQTDFVALKETAGPPRLTEMRRLKNRLRWLESLVNTAQLLADIPPARIKQFADEARALETDHLLDTNPSRR